MKRITDGDICGIIQQVIESISKLSYCYLFSSSNYKEFQTEESSCSVVLGQEKERGKENLKGENAVRMPTAKNQKPGVIILFTGWHS